MVVDVLMGWPPGRFGTAPCTAACETSEANPSDSSSRATELVRDGQGGLADPAAAPADDVQVGGVLGEVVARRPVVDVGVPDQAELLQRLERPVHGRRGHGVRAVGGHGIHDLLGGGVTEPPHGGQHALALRRQALAARPQPLPEITHPTNVCRTQADVQTAHLD